MSIESLGGGGGGVGGGGGADWLTPGCLVPQVCRRKAKERMVFLFSDMLVYGRHNLLDKVEAVRSVGVYVAF